MFLSLLRQLPGVRRVDTLSRADADQTALIVETEKGSAFQQALFRLLSGLSAPILELSPLTDSLEEMFLCASSGQTREGEKE